MVRTLAEAALTLFLRGLLVHSKLDDDDRQAILSLPTKVSSVSAHREFAQFAGARDSVCLVAEGLVGQVCQASDGVMQIISLHLPGDMVDLASTALPMSRAMVAMTASTVLHVPQEALTECAERSRPIADAFMRSCLVDASIQAQWLFHIGRRDAYTRMAHFLCEMRARYAAKGLANGPSFRLPMTQEQLGDTLGLTPVHVNRTLKLLREEKLLMVTRSMVTILDQEGLARVGEFNPAYLHLGVVGEYARQAA